MLGIVGGSVAGLSTAISALEYAPVQVTVYEKKRWFGEPCGGAIGIYMFNRLKDTYKRLIANSTLSPIFDVEIFSPNGQSWSISSSTPIGFLVDRSRLEKNMADEVIKYGGKVLTGTYVKSIRFDRIETDKGVELYDYVVDARGLQTPFPDKSNIHHCAQIEMSTPYFKKGSIKLYFGNSIAPKGYAWIFTVEDGLSKIGLETPLSLKLNPGLLLEKFVKSNSELDYELYKRIEKKSLQSKIIPMSKAGTLIENGVFHVGDRAMLCDPLTGGGIATAILSGDACAKSIVLGKPKDYEKYASDVLTANRFRYMVKRKILSKLDDEGFNDLIEGVQGFTPTFRDFDIDITKAFMNLLLEKPNFF